MILLLMCVAFVEAFYLVLVGWMIARTWLRRKDYARALPTLAGLTLPFGTTLGLVLWQARVGLIGPEWFQGPAGKVVQFATLGLLDFVFSLFGAYVLTLTLAALAWLVGLIPCVWLGRPRRQALGYYLFGGALWAGAIAALPLAFPLTALIEVGLGG